MKQSRLFAPTVRCCFAIVISALVAVLLSLSGCSARAPRVSLPDFTPDYWPTAGFRAATPESQGMKSGPLADMLEMLDRDRVPLHSVLVVRNGYLVLEAYFDPYSADQPIHLQSITKTVVGALAGVAISEGRIGGVRDKLSRYLPAGVSVDERRAAERISLENLLSMTSGLDYQEFSGTGPSMEQSPDWVSFMLMQGAAARPGTRFSYSNGDAHLASAALSFATGMSAKTYANEKLFGPLGIRPVGNADWPTDPQGITAGGYGLHLTPREAAKIGLLYLAGGRWEGRRLFDSAWAEDSFTQHATKEDGSGYGYLWTVYPKKARVAALGLGGQQLHIIPEERMVIVVTAALEAYAEAPEIERMIDDYILPAAVSEAPLAPDGKAGQRLERAVARVARPVEEAQGLPGSLSEVSGVVYRFPENPFGWQSIEFDFDRPRLDADATVSMIFNGFPTLIGMDNVYRRTDVPGLGTIFLRGNFRGAETLEVDYPYSFIGPPSLAELGASTITFRFLDSGMEVTASPRIFGSEPFMHIAGVASR